MADMPIFEECAMADEHGRFSWPAPLAPRADCPECKGTGLRDSGGAYPWGEPIMLACDCASTPTPDTPTDRSDE